MKEFFAAPIAPPEITYPAERLEYTRRGANPHGSFKNNLAISFDWTAKVLKQDIPVYFTPMSHGGPHSFAQIIKNEEHTSLTITLNFAHKLRSVKVRSRQMQIQWNTQEENIVCTVEECGTFTVEVNDGIYAPITVFVRPPIELPQDNDSSVLRFGPGYHQVDYIELQSSKKVFIDAEAIVHAVAPDKTELPKIEKDWADKPNYKDFITATGSANIEISGYGILDLSELEWHARRTICFFDCDGIVINGPILLGAAHWTVALFHCKNVVLKNLVLFGYRENSDGIDIVNCENVQVDNCFIRTGDDGICIKSMQSSPIYGGKNIIVENCTIWNDKVRALSIAGESKSDISNVIFRNCEVLHSLADWAHELGALCIVLCDSGTVHDIIYENIMIYQESAQAINCMLFKDQWSTDIEVGHIKNVTFRNIAVPENACIRMWGYDEAHCVENIKLQNIIGAKSNLLLDCNAYTKNIIL